LQIIKPVFPRFENDELTLDDELSSKSCSVLPRPNGILSGMIAPIGQMSNRLIIKEVPYDKIVKGYKYDDYYVIIEDADFESAAPEKSKVIGIESFVDVAAVNPMFYETSSYTAPATKKIRRMRCYSQR